MQINKGAQNLMTTFYDKGTLGMGAKRQEFEGMDAMMAVMTRAGHCTDIAVLDNTAEDRDKTKGVIDLRPEDAARLVTPGFGAITSYKAEFKAEDDCVEAMTVEVSGPESHMIKHMAVSGADVTIFEALSKGEKGLVTAGKITRNDLEDTVKGYMEILDNIPWHIAR